MADTRGKPGYAVMSWGRTSRMWRPRPTGGRPGPSPRFSRGGRCWRPDHQRDKMVTWSFWA